MKVKAVSESMVSEPERILPRLPKDSQDIGSGTAYPCLVISPRKVDFAACQRMRSDRGFERQCAACGCPWKNYHKPPPQQPKEKIKTKTYEAVPVMQVQPELPAEPAAMPVSTAILKRDRKGRLIPVRDQDSLRPVRMNFHRLSLVQRNVARQISLGLSEMRIAEIMGRSEFFVHDRFEECLRVLGLVDSTEGMSPEDFAVARAALAAVRPHLL